MCLCIFFSKEKNTKNMLFTFFSQEGFLHYPNSERRGRYDSETMYYLSVPRSMLLNVVPNLLDCMF